jgi:hypothetical protein
MAHNSSNPLTVRDVAYSHTESRNAAPGTWAKRRLN